MQAKLLITRLERLSVDSVWAHRASGIRGSLLRCLEELDAGYSKKITGYLDDLLNQGYFILEQAVKTQYKNG
jgi:hypothetical protein